MICQKCGTENPEGNKFCGNCANPLELTCPNCGADNPGSMKFCGQCATPLNGEAPPVSEPVTERRLVTVLFADLTGYTTFSEGRDSEEVRKFLTDYFDRSRSIIERFGGLVEKFIGDAVMAVWGADVAHEDDAERAVRAGLELAELVEKLSADIGASDLRLRVGVHTGEAAVGPGEDHMGFVTGDLVNTASRLESVAEPGTVLVGESTKQSASQAIAFEPAGEQQLKGKDEVVTAWRATRILSQIGGLGRAEALEPPFVGRSNELRLLKDVLESARTERKARLVSIVGEAGIGKSRLIWELKKFVDGLSDDTYYWHEGRSPAYGDGVTFWAVAEMIRSRAGLLADANDADTYGGLDSALKDLVDDQSDRRWLLPRLSAVLGTGEAPPGKRAELDSAVRSFFQAVATRGPVVMVFEDLHWADGAMLDFVAELPEWWGEQPVLIVTLARPDLVEKRPEWGSGPNVISLNPGPLTDSHMHELVIGTIPGLPDSAADDIVDRAAGVPLYAVELIRGLIESGDIETDGERYHVVGDLEELSIPESLQAVIGARLDRFAPEDRQLIQDAAVVGQSFVVDALAAVLGNDVAEVTARLDSIAARQVISVIRDERSPERGQYQFVQSLIREVALSRMSKDLRRERHLAVAAYMEDRDEPELAMVVASHYLDALQASPPGNERDALRLKVLASLNNAVQRASSLRAYEQMISLSHQALSVAESDSERVAFWVHLTEAGGWALDRKAVNEYGGQAIDHYRAAGDEPGEWHALSAMGNALVEMYDWHEATALLEPIVVADIDLTSDPALARIAGTHARAYSILVLDSVRDVATGHVYADRALRATERLRMTPETIDALITRASLLGIEGRLKEAQVMFRGAIALADQHQLVGSQARARNNYLVMGGIDVATAIRIEHDALEISERAGDRNFPVLAKQVKANFMTHAGDFDEALTVLDEIDNPEAAYEMMRLWPRAKIHSWRGESEQLDEVIDEVTRIEAAEPDRVHFVQPGDFVAIRDAFSGNRIDSFEYGVHQLEHRVSGGFFAVDSLIHATLADADPKRLNRAITALYPWPQHDLLRNCLVLLEEVAGGTFETIASLESAIDAIESGPEVPLAVTLWYGAAQYLPDDHPKRAEWIERSKSIAAKRGWHGFLEAIDSE